MNKALLLQIGLGEAYGEMLDISRERHEAYCKRHRFDLWAVREDVWPQTPAMWQKYVWMQAAWAVGYEFVVYVDADAMIVDESADLRAALRRKPLGLVYGQTPGGEPAHYNCGVIFARRHPWVDVLWGALLSRTPGREYEPGPKWWEDAGSEQRLLNELLRLPWFAETVVRLDRRWHSLAGLDDLSRAVIVGWHGLPGAGKKAEAMRGWPVAGGR